MSTTDTAEPEVEVSESSPVYASFATIQNLVERMEKEGIPSQIDKTYLSFLAGGYRSQVLLGLRTLGLIHDDGKVSGLLTALVTAPDSRRNQFRGIIEHHYGWAIALGPNATHGQLVEVFKERGPRLSANTREKAIAFYLHASKYAGMPVSPFFKGRRQPASSNGSSTTPRPRRKARTTRREDENLPPPPSSVRTTSDEERRDAYFRVLLDMAKAKEEPDSDLLDRIERLLGQPTATSKEAK